MAEKSAKIWWAVTNCEDKSAIRAAVAASFIVRRVQPYKERAHPAFEFKGETDGTRERPEMLSRDVVEERAVELFALFASFKMSGYSKCFNYKNLPPQVNISGLHLYCFLSFIISDHLN